MDLQPNGMALALDDLGRNQLSVTQSTLEMRRKETVQDWTSATGSKKCGNTLGLGILRGYLCCFGFHGYPSSPTIIALGTTA